MELGFGLLSGDGAVGAGGNSELKVGKINGGVVGNSFRAIFLGSVAPGMTSSGTKIM